MAFIDIMLCAQEMPRRRAKKLKTVGDVDCVTLAYAVI